MDISILPSAPAPARCARKVLFLKGAPGSAHEIPGDVGPGKPPVKDGKRRCRCLAQGREHSLQEIVRSIPGLEIMVHEVASRAVAYHMPFPACSQVLALDPCSLYDPGYLAVGV